MIEPHINNKSTQTVEDNALIILTNAHFVSRILHSEIVFVCPHRWHTHKCHFSDFTQSQAQRLAAVPSLQGILRILAGIPLSFADDRSRQSVVVEQTNDLLVHTYHLSQSLVGVLGSLGKK